MIEEIKRFLVFLEVFFSFKVRMNTDRLYLASTLHHFYLYFQTVYCKLYAENVFGGEWWMMVYTIPEIQRIITPVAQ